VTALRFSIGFACAVGFVTWASNSSAQDVARVDVATRGSGDDGMPGVIRTDSADALPEGIAVSVSSAYGLSGATLEDSDSHHRAAARLAVAYALSSDLGVALRLDGRYDKHFLETERDDGWVGDPRLIGRYRRDISSGFAAGAQLGIWAPGSNAPSVEFSAISAEAVLALSWSAAGLPLQVSANAGYRLDRSAASVDEPERLSLSDRMSLGVSDSNAVLAALGVSYDVGPVELLAEWSVDVLHGSDAPSFSSSPMRVGLGVRHELSGGWQLFANSEFRLSKVLAQDVAETLFPVDPRISVLAGLQLRFGQSKKPTPVVVEPEPEPKPEPEPDPKPVEKGPVSGRVASGGSPVAEVKLVLVDAKGDEHAATTGADGTFALKAIALGDAQLTATAEGYETAKQPVVVTIDGAPLAVQLQAILPPGQLRGKIRSFRGEGLQGKLTVEPGGQSIDTDAEGNFELDLPPGEYEVAIVVDGFKAQSRKIRVDENGVTIMNVDMRKKGRRK
tara:strand:- start:18353 stop:19864 length:1512 start_codon:yes stop_codon:yes gene_type:complete